ncbi:MAG: GAF domain-containing sensor histidine kinase [Chloroflexi bacterium]|nr:GAF domain-containing sensor histidine kinase [Chloroflexota bacterium]
MKETEILYEVGRALISTLDHEKVLQQILKIVQESLGYSRVGILLIDEETGELYVKAASGHAPQVTKEVRLRVGRDGITGWVASTGAPLNVPDVSRDSRYVPGPSPAASELALPLRIGSQTIGVLDVQSNRKAAFGARDLRILSSFADQAAIAIENARLYDRTRQMGVIEERNRLAREIHDVLTQNLTGTLGHLEAADGLLGKGDYAKAQEVLRRAMEQARQGLQEARRSIVGLRAAPLEYLPLAQVLATEVNAFIAETGLHVSYQVNGDDSVLPPEATTSLYRICKEALSNIRCHAAAQNVSISLSIGRQSCMITIQDDGVGFDPSQIDYLNSTENRFGLVGMRERARVLGGTMILQSGAAAGTWIKVEIPVKGQRPAEEDAWPWIG